jgi:hypothetical protein
MITEIPVECTTSKSWCPFIDEESVSGTLIDISTQTTESGKLIPVGIVLLDNENTFHSVPMEFITATQA